MKTDKLKDKASKSAVPDNDQKPEHVKSAGSSTSMKSRKSGSLISALIRRTKRSKSKPNTQTSCDESQQVTFYNVNYDLHSNSSNQTSKHEEDNEIELCVQNYEKEEGDGSQLMAVRPPGNASIQDTAAHLPNSQSKIPGERSTLDYRKYCHSVCEGSEGGYGEDDCNDASSRGTHYDQCTQLSARDVHIQIMSPKGLPITHVDFGRDPLNTPLCKALRHIHDIMGRLSDSEAHIVRLLKKYIGENDFHKELMDVIAHRSKMQWEAEHEALELSNDMWKQQTEVIKEREETLDRMIHCVTSENRHLMLEIEKITRKYERQVTVNRLYGDYRARGPKSLEGNSSIVADLVKNNHRLQDKMADCLQELEMYQNHLSLVQTNYNYLEDFVDNLHLQIQNLKEMLSRNSSTHELEVLHLSQQITEKDRLIKDSLDAGNLVIEDLDSLKQQLKELPFKINWNKFMSHTNCLSDVLHICRACINELGGELVETHNKILLKDRDISNLMEANSRLQENLQKSTNELDSASKQTGRGPSQEDYRNCMEQERKHSEAVIETLQSRCRELEEERTKLVRVIEEKEDSRREISQKLKLLEESGRVISSMTSENCELRSQIDALNRMLAESGAGDVARELATSHDKITQFQTQYYQLLAEKTILVQQISTLTAERNNLVQCQEMYYQQLQTQLKDMEIMNTENSCLKNQVESEKATLISLQAERKRYLEEKAILKTIFNQLRAEISRVQQLEGTVSTMTKETNRLALIAEYNKQLGERLKVEVEERDNTINDLKSSVEKLNTMQMENTKDKLALCAELSEACNMKDRLNSSLEKELQKNMELDETKKKLESNSNSKLKVLEEIQKNERATLKELFRDFKSVLNQRDSLLEVNKRSQQDIMELKSHCVMQLQRCDSFCSQLDEKEGKIKELESQVDKYEILLKKTHNKMKCNVDDYESRLRHLEGLVKQLRKQNDEQENSIRYLKNNSNKLHVDLNEARQAEKDALDKFTRDHEECQNLKDKVDHYERDLKHMEAERQELMNEVRHLNEAYDKMLSELDLTMRSASKKEDIFKHEMQESKDLLIASGQQLENLNMALTNRDLEIMRLQEECTTLQKRAQKLDEMEKKYHEQRLLLRQTVAKNDKLDDEARSHKMKERNLNNQIKSLYNDVSELEKQLKSLAEQKQQSDAFYKNQIETMTKDYEKKKHTLESELNTLKMQINSISDRYQDQKSKHDSLSHVHSQISEKLVNTVKMLMEEKNISEDRNLKLTELKAELEKLKLENGELCKQNEKLKEEFNEEKLHMLQISHESDENQRRFEELQSRYEDFAKSHTELEKELKNQREKFNNVLCQAANTDNEQVDKTVYNETLAQLQSAEARLEKLKTELDESHVEHLGLKDKIAKMQHQLTALEFQRCEATLRIHEMQGKVETEHNLYIQAKNDMQQLLSEIMRMRDDGRIAVGDCTDLLRMVRASADM